MNNLPLLSEWLVELEEGVQGTLVTWMLMFEYLIQFTM